MSGRKPSAGARKRPIVAIAMGAFWPGNESSGPNISLVGLCRALADDFEFKILARDRAFGAQGAAAPSGRWRDLGYAEARAFEIGLAGARGLREALQETQYDLLWLSGFFDREFTIPALALRRLGLAQRKPTLLSPRGEFADGALGLKSLRKQVWLAASRAGFLTDVTLHATSAHERADIETQCSWAKSVVDAPNVRANIAPPPRVDAPMSKDHPLRLAFLGRISPVKNLDLALAILCDVRTPVAFDIFGPISDAVYWRACQTAIASLPPNVTVRYRGEIPNEAVPAAMTETDALLLPTKGENFGHAIYEALACGAPALISDRTPWRDLESRHAGWDLPLDSPPRFVAAIETFAAMSEDERARWRAGARAVAADWITRSDAVAANRAMLRALARGPE